ncbi:MAG: L-rhamnose mutarotase [Oscillospiraceae bacterium]|nr:L-rhamnose mutarotase [Oscillospiraceae bacterium]
MRRFILHSYLKPEKVEEYVELHRNTWPEVLDLISKTNITNYSISIKGNELFTYYEYVGDDYEADMKIQDDSPIMQEWWKHTTPCFLYHDKGHYYDELEEIFYLK